MVKSRPAVHGNFVRLVSSVKGWKVSMKQERTGVVSHDWVWLVALDFWLSR